MDMPDALALEQSEDPIKTLYKLVLAKHVALIELLMNLEVIPEDSTDILFKREQHWLAHYDQLETERALQRLHADSREGEEARIKASYLHANATGTFDATRFSQKYAELRSQIGKKDDKV